MCTCYRPYIVCLNVQFCSWRFTQDSMHETCELFKNSLYYGNRHSCIITTVMASIYSLSALRITLPLDSKTRGGTSFTVWYSTDGHDRDPSTPPQRAPMVSTGLNATSVTITLPESDNSCKPYYVWIAGNTPNGQQGPYSKRQQVEVCKSYRGEHETMNTGMYSMHNIMYMECTFYVCIGNCINI